MLHCFEQHATCVTFPLGHLQVKSWHSPSATESLHELQQHMHSVSDEADSLEMEIPCWDSIVDEGHHC